VLYSRGGRKVDKASLQSVGSRYLSRRMRLKRALWGQGWEATRGGAAGRGMNPGLLSPVHPKKTCGDFSGHSLSILLEGVCGNAWLLLVNVSKVPES
jgi:hypothetical protein